MEIYRGKRKWWNWNGILEVEWNIEVEIDVVKRNAGFGIGILDVELERCN